MLLGDPDIAFFTSLPFFCSVLKSGRFLYEWSQILSLKILKLLTLQRYLMLFENFMHTSFSVWQVSPMASSMYLGDLFGQSFQGMPLLIGRITLSSTLRVCAKVTLQFESRSVRPEVSKDGRGSSCFDTSAWTDLSRETWSYFCSSPELSQSNGWCFFPQPDFQVP